MPKRTVTASSQRGRKRVQRTRSLHPLKPMPPDLVYGVPVPAGLHDAIERERDNLGKAESLLGCLVIALEHGTDTATPPYYPDVADIAKELVRASINGLDSLSLQRVLTRDEVTEPAPFLPLPASLPVLDVRLQTRGATALARVMPIRALHRRHYVSGAARGTGRICTPGRSIPASA